MSNNPSQGGGGGDTLSELAAVLAAPLVVLVLALAAGATLAGLLGAQHHLLPFDPPAALIALAHFHDPAVAWPLQVRPDVPSPVAYWTVTGVVVLVVLAGLAAAWLAWETRKSRPQRSTTVNPLTGESSPRSPREIARLLSPEEARKRMERG